MPFGAFSLYPPLVTVVFFSGEAWQWQLCQSIGLKNRPDLNFARLQGEAHRCVSSFFILWSFRCSDVFVYCVSLF